MLAGILKHILNVKNLSVLSIKQTTTIIKKKPEFTYLCLEKIKEIKIFTYLGIYVNL